MGGVTPGAAWWIGAGLLACGLEMLTPGIFLLPVGVAAVLAGLAVLLGAGGHTPWVVFVVAIGVLVVSAARFRRGRPADVTNGPGAGVVGASCIADGFAGAEGRVRLGDGAWPARMADRTEPAFGTRLRVVELDGTTLVVSRLVP